MLLADVVWAVHFLLVAFMVYAPLFGGSVSLCLAEAGYVLLMLHWKLNSDVCALTLLEQKLRGVEKSASFVQALVGPVYGVSETALGRTVWTISVVLFLIGLARLALMKGKPPAWLEGRTGVPRATAAPPLQTATGSPVSAG